MAGFQIEVTTTGASESVTLPLVTGYTYDCTVDWGEGAPVAVTAWDDADATHVYATPGTYTVEITGTCPGWSVNNTHSSKLQWTDIVYWGDAVDFDGFSYLTGGFRGCSNIQSLGTGKIQSSGLSSLAYCWRDCSGLTGSIPVGLLDNCPLITSMYACWYGCSGLTGSIPVGLLDNCTLITDMSFCWYNCPGLTGSIPVGLLDNCPLITNMYGCWSFCGGLTLSPWIFYADGEQDTKFLNRSINFTNCFYRASTTGDQGQAPDLWDCDFGIGTATKTNCFAGGGNNGTSLSNYTSIPYEWGGKSLFLVVTDDNGDVSNSKPVTIT